MADRPQVTGNQGAMIYLADSISDMRNAQLRTNELLKELIELARAGASNSHNEPQDDEEPDEIAGLQSLLKPNGATAPK